MTRALPLRVGYTARDLVCKNHMDADWLARRGWIPRAAILTSNFTKHENLGHIVFVQGARHILNLSAQFGVCFVIIFVLLLAQRSMFSCLIIFVLQRALRGMSQATYGKGMRVI